MTLLLAMIRHPSDTELVDRFKEGDRTAYTEIVRRYQDRVYTLAFRWMHDDQIAREVAQDVFLALYRALGGFRGDAKLSTWIHRVVVNHCKNRRLYRRRRQTDLHEPLEGRRTDDDVPARQLAHDGPGTDAAIHRSEAEALVREALEHLDEEQRTIIVLRDVEDLGYDEIADILGVARGTVKSRLHRARATLAKVLSRRIDQRDVI
ncbi:MAG: sigma-70 family RNA polymerase sigma factor [Myxococcales bacterium]|nr:sigma-70 family RNA polymerase sigma factor [Myxococcales bacterium]MCB9668995.1 sigma-70 family RNA polymerase sigma factor [Alphaproteobacteria bacterium]MCB9691322.1 sigma-70 family RNA polymerase sigma factor [Alphaproteobacteria bacterium]